MKINFLYDFCDVVPDELDYLLEIFNLVCDYFYHDDINFYITNNSNIQLSTKNNIIFLTGCELDSKLKDDNFKLCFNNFYRNFNDSRYIPLPLGNNKFINKTLFNNKLIEFNDRQYDIFFAGFIHPSRIGFQNTIESLKCKKYIHYTRANNLQNFTNDLNPQEYLEILKNSKIVLAPSGAYHASSYRYFESLYFKNIVIFEKPKNQEIFLNKNFPNQYLIDNWNDVNDLFIKDIINKYTDDKISFKENFSKINIVNFIISKINDYK
jgi:hypothetical protein